MDFTQRPSASARSSARRRRPTLRPSRLQPSIIAHDAVLPDQLARAPVQRPFPATAYAPPRPSPLCSQWERAIRLGKVDGRKFATASRCSPPGRFTLHWRRACYPLSHPKQHRQLPFRTELNAPRTSRLFEPSPIEDVIPHSSPWELNLERHGNHPRTLVAFFRRLDAG